MNIIRFQCQGCGAKVRTTADRAGMTGKCPECGHMMTVPQVISSSEADGPDTIELELEGQPEPPVQSPDTPADAGEVLAAYRQAMEPSASGLKRGIDAVKTRALATRLNWDAKNLRLALEDQRERLGALAAQHRPPGMDIRAQANEIARVQAEFDENRTRLDSLRGTQGSRSMIKELNAEQAQLMAWQRELMLAVGAKVESARPEMPGAAGHYSAIDRVRAQLLQKEAQLAKLRVDSGKRTVRAAPPQVAEAAEVEQQDPDREPEEADGLVLRDQVVRRRPPPPPPPPPPPSLPPPPRLALADPGRGQPCPACGTRSSIPYSPGKEYRCASCGAGLWITIRGQAARRSWSPAPHGAGLGVVQELAQEYSAEDLVLAATGDGRSDEQLSRAQALADAEKELLEAIERRQQAAEQRPGEQPTGMQRLAAVERELQGQGSPGLAATAPVVSPPVAPAPGAPPELMTYEIEDRSCARLFEVATPELYRWNAFRVLSLPVTATISDVRRRQSRLKMMEKLGMASSRQGSGYLPLEPPPGEDAMRDAMHRLHDPEARLLDEFFWFWPRQIGTGEDDGLKGLADNRVDQALALWLDGEKQSSDSRTSTHNIAVLYHLMALDFEHRTREGDALSEKDEKARRTCWLRAHRRWSALLDDEGFWSRLTARIRELDDPRLTTGLARRIRGALPDALLLINARIAVYAAENGNRTEARRQVLIMEKSGCEASQITSALRESLSAVRQRIKMICEPAEARADADPENADKVTAQLIKEARPLLGIIDMLLPESDFVRRGAHDEVAHVALRCQITYGNKTEDWKQSLTLLKEILPLAGSESLSGRIKENADIVENNLKAGTCFFCEMNKADDNAAAEVEMYGNVQRQIEWNGVRVTWNHGTIKIPRCAECKKNHTMISTWMGVFGVLGAIVGGLGFAATWWIGILGLIIMAAIGAAAGEAIGKSNVPYDIKGDEEKSNYHAVKELKSQGWEFGAGPSTS